MSTNDAYNKFYRLPELSYNAIKYMMDSNELIWKLLKYNEATAWNQPNLTKAQKGALIFDGLKPETDCRVFMDVGMSDAWTHECCIVRISPFDAIPDNRTVGTVQMMFEVYSHYSINHLSNYTTRIDTISQQFLQVFNGYEIGGIGKLYFDRYATPNNRMSNAGQIPFKGKMLLMSTKVG